MNEKIVTFKLELTSLFTTIFEQAEKRMVLEEQTAPVVTDEWQYIDMSHLLMRLVFDNICREEKLDLINIFIDYTLNHTSNSLVKGNQDYRIPLGMTYLS